MSEQPPQSSNTDPPDSGQPGAGPESVPAWDRASSDFSTSVYEMVEVLRRPAAGAQQFRDMPPAAGWRRHWFNARLWVQRLGVLLRTGIRRWVKFHPGLLGRLVETLVWPAAFVALGWFSNPGNPFFVNDGFPWPWLGPWLIAMRYGSGYGAAATLLLLGAWGVLAPSVEFPRLYFLGGAITTLIAGEFGGYWGLRATRLREAVRYLNDKVDRLTRRLYLVKLSHDELEYELVDRPGTLRDALIDLRVLMEQEQRNRKGASNPLPGAQLILDFIGHHCRIESAAIYQVRVFPEIKMWRVARIGQVVDPKPDDPMVVRAVETGRLLHLQDTMLDEAHRSALIAAAPITDSEQDTVGLLAVSSMPFSALTTENLQTIGILLESYADYVRLDRLTADSSGIWPEAPKGLVGEIAWLSRLQQNFDLQSYCVIWRVDHPDRVKIISELQQLHMRGEVAWRWPTDRNLAPVCVIALVPFAGAAQTLVYKQRILQGITRSFGEVTPTQLNSQDVAVQGNDTLGRLRAAVEGMA